MMTRTRWGGDAQRKGIAAVMGATGRRRYARTPHAGRWRDFDAVTTILLAREREMHDFSLSAVRPMPPA